MENLAGLVELALGRVTHQPRARKRALDEVPRPSEELEGLEYASTETEAATDCRYLDYDSNPAISAEVAAERGEPNPHKATKTN